ncbi:hypothetical protein HK16_04015 [Acetobacter senegalensis]|uniref:EAL domain-containing protein n=3 Tax=Acetobacteraceae TaxID=433 RepID=A0A252EDU9_9PROT|nr:hypothetical protein CIW82_06640 [Acetobacter tropicalis]OUL64589.1 hypothetical protein HK16_04015 [Acetobacter senegalensis]
MDTDDFYALVDAAGRDEDAYVRVDRLRITKEFLEGLCEDSDEIKEMSVTDIIDLMEGAL